VSNLPRATFMLRPRTTASQLLLAQCTRPDCCMYINGADARNCDVVVSVFGATLMDLLYRNPSRAAVNASFPSSFKCSLNPAFRFCA
jgi:hypothetical protein